jgi:hypothetical protein
MKFELLTDHVIHGTEFWTSTNIADGLNALAICIEVRELSSEWFFPSMLTVDHR